MNYPSHSLFTYFEANKSGDNISLNNSRPLDFAQIGKRKHDLKAAESALRTLLERAPNISEKDIASLKTILSAAIPMVLTELHGVLELYKTLEPEITPMTPEALLLARKRTVEEET